MKYRYNPSCSCARCRTHGYMGPAVLITLGVIFLLDQLGHSHWMDWGSTWPALLIVIGLVLFLQHNASPAGHVAREYGALPPQAYPGAPGYPVAPPVVTPPSAPSAGSLNPGNPGVDDRGVHNG